MMFCLASNVALYCGTSRGTYRESCITFLPSEIAIADYIMNPNRRGLFEFPQHVRQAMCCFKTNEQMNVIGDSAYALNESTKAVDSSAQVFMKARLPLAVNDRSPFFCREDEMIMQGEKGRTHVSPVDGF